MHVYNALSTACSASSSSEILDLIALRISPTVRCIRSQIAFVVGFFAVVGFAFTPKFVNMVWKGSQMNSPPLS